MNANVNADVTTLTAMETLLRETYRPEELAALLRIDVEVIRHAVFSGDLPAKLVGHDIVGINRSDVVVWLKQRE